MSHFADLLLNRRGRYETNHEAFKNYLQHQVAEYGSGFNGKRIQRDYSMNEFKSQKIKSCLKDLLKKKNLTYEDLAVELECSVPTIKRILGPEELTLNRLLELCDILGIDLAELEIMTKENDVKEEKFTEAQDEFLAKNQNYYAYLMKLFEGKSPKEIQEEYKLTQKSTDKYLIGLEKHELIRVTGKQRVKPNFKMGPTLGNGPLAKAFFGSFINKASNFFIGIVREGLRTPKNEKTKSPGRFAMMTAKATHESYDKWVKEQEKLLRDFQKLSSLEEKTKPKEDLKTCVIISAHAYVDHDHLELKALDNALGDITNF